MAHGVSRNASSPTEVLRTGDFDGWLSRLRDRQARARIIARVDRLAAGNFGDAKPLGGGIAELRIDYGPGYRLYFTRRGTSIVLLLIGGDKSRQRADIERARQLAGEWKADHGT